MAIMMDNKPTEYKGEALVWEKLYSLLPNDVVIYNHREVVDDREFDFALLIKDVGILVLEVKGWQAQYIFDVKNPDEIVIEGESKIYGSPEKQARGYRFDWLNFLNDQFGISPIVLSMVCYPFISEEEYKDVRLDIVSSKDFTIFSEDLNSISRLGQKILNAFIKKKPLNSTPFDEKAMAIVRQHFEPSYKAKDDQVVEVSDAYSFLKVFGRNLSESDIEELVCAYFAGTKMVLFVKSENDLRSISMQLASGFRERGIISDKGNIRLAESGEEQIDFVNGNKSFRIFNFEIYVYELDIEKDETIIEGQYTEQQKSILEDVANSTNWNFDQFKVEHANGDKNILVQAGAGTGKTYSMVSRIAYLCLSKDINNVSVIEFDNITEFSAYVAHIYEDAVEKYYADEQKKGSVLSYMREQFYSANSSVNDILKVYFPEQFGERHFLAYPIGHFFVAVTKMWNSENGGIKIEDMNDIAECLCSGALYEKKIGSLITTFNQTRNYFSSLSGLKVYG